MDEKVKEMWWDGPDFYIKTIYGKTYKLKNAWVSKMEVEPSEVELEGLVIRRGKGNRDPNHPWRKRRYKKNPGFLF